jgi:hypothetical protein
MDKRTHPSMAIVIGNHISVGVVSRFHDAELRRTSFAEVHLSFPGVPGHDH